MYTTCFRNHVPCPIAGTESTGLAIGTGGRTGPWFVDLSIGSNAPGKVFDRDCGPTRERAWRARRVRIQLVVTVETASELHRPRWEDHPSSPAKRQLHLGFYGGGMRDVHVILASEAAVELFQLL